MKYQIFGWGQNAIEELTLYGLDVAKDVAFHPTAYTELLIGAEGGIIKTTNNGEEWTAIRKNHEESRFYFGVNYDPYNPDILYAGGWLKNFSTHNL